MAALLVAGVLAASGGLVTLAGVPGPSDARGAAQVDQQELRRVTSLRRIALDPAVAPALVPPPSQATANGDAAVADTLSAAQVVGTDGTPRGDASAGATLVAVAVEMTATEPASDD